MPEDRCVICGEIIPEGQQVCNGCQEEQEERTCGTCMWYERKEEICCNYRSSHVADFMRSDDTCEKWEENEIK